MNLYQKFKGSVMKAAVQAQQLVATVSAITTDIAAELSLTTGESNSRESQRRSPPDELMALFRDAINTIDSLADSDLEHSAESEKQLYSKVRQQLLAMVNLLQSEGDRWLAKYSESPDPEVSELPCLDAFLKAHMMQELCSRAVRDLPRGCLPLVMGWTARLLRSVKYPLLPHQTVHKPIANLVSVASRFDAMHTGSSGISKEELASYKNRIDIDLTNLITTLWRKISENPPVLDYFTLFDMRPSRVDGIPVPLHAQMDILTALISLMSKPRVGVFAKKALLTAVGMHDRRVDSFVVLNTDLVEGVIAELCKRFQAALDAEIEPAGGHDSVSGRHFGGAGQTGGASRTPTGARPAPTQASLLRAAQANTQLQNPVKPADANSAALEAFIKAIRFCDLLISSCTPLEEVELKEVDSEASSCLSPVSPRSPLPSSLFRSRDQQHSTVNWDEARDTRARANSRSAGLDSSRFANAPPLKAQFLREYSNFFLESNVRIALLANAEVSALAINSLVRKLLFELKHGCCSGDTCLLHATTEFLCSSTNVWLACAAEGAETGASQAFRTPSHGKRSGQTSGSELTPASDLAGSLISRSLSVSKTLSTSTINLINDILLAAPLEHGLLLLMKSQAAGIAGARALRAQTPASSANGAAGTSDDVDFGMDPALATSPCPVPEVSATVGSPSHLALFVAAEGKKAKDAPTTVSHTDYLTLCSAVGTTSSTSSTTVATPKSMTFSVDTRIGHICSILTQTSARPDDDPTIEKGKGQGLDQQYIHAATENILSRIADRLFAVEAFARGNELFDSPIRTPSSGTHSTPSYQYAYIGELGHSALMALLARKLSQFLNLKNEEQLVITSLVSCCVGLLSAATIVPPTGIQLKANQRLHNSCYLTSLLDVLLAVEKIWLDLRGHVNKISEFGIKFTAVRHVMLQTATHRRVDPVLRKLVDKETVHVRKVLESSVMAREMLAEVRGSIHATRKLRNSLQSLSIPNRSNSNNLNGFDAHMQWGQSGADGWGLPDEDLAVEEEEDLWEKHEDLELQKRKQEEEISRGVGVQVDEEGFLLEVDALEKGLDSLLTPFH